jgi:hypothetical protein
MVQNFHRPDCRQKSHKHLFKGRRLGIAAGSRRVDKSAPNRSAYRWQQHSRICESDCPGAQLPRRDDGGELAPGSQNLEWLTHGRHIF